MATSSEIDNSTYDSTVGAKKTTQATRIAGEDLTNDVLKVLSAMNYTVPLTASGVVKTGAGVLAGYIVSSHSGGSVKAWDNTSAATTVIHDTWTLAAGPQVILLPKPIRFSTGLYLTLAGTISLTPIWL